MPILNNQLDPTGHSIVDLVILPSLPRRRALQSASQSVSSANPVLGMIDTGATITIIDSRLRRSLNVIPFRMRRATVPSTPVPLRVWSFKIDLAILYPPVSFVLPMLSVLEMPLAHMGVEVLVGCDVLSRCQFMHDGLAHSFSLKY